MLAGGAAAHVFSSVQLARGGVADVYLGCVLQPGSAPASTAIEAMNASTDVVVKVYIDNVRGCTAEQLHGFAHREQMALSLLRGQIGVVQLLGTAALQAADAAESNSAAAAGANTAAGCVSSSSSALPTGNTCSNHSSSSNNSTNNGGYQQTCLLLEYLPMGAITNNKGECTEGLARALLWPLLQLLDVMQSGILGCRIVHRDIKPDNLLIRMSKEGPVLVLADFGVCYIEVDPKANGNTVAGMHTVIGSRFFTAPEVVAAAPAASVDGSLNASIDCYGLGVVVTQMLKCLQLEDGTPVTNFQQQLEAFVDAPGDDKASAAVREFVGCCCGVGQLRAAAVANGKPARLTPAQLLETAWMSSR